MYDVSIIFFITVFHETPEKLCFDKLGKDMESLSAALIKISQHRSEVTLKHTATVWLVKHIGHHSEREHTLCV